MKKLENCPDCGSKLHIGQHRFNDGLYMVYSCKECGFKEEEPLDSEERIRHMKEK